MNEPCEFRSLLVIGGVRSGKSRYGQKCAERSGKTRVLVATAEAGDAEMAARIVAHQQTRGEGWRVIEESLALVPVLQREAAADRILVVDCLTLWLSNLLHEGEDPQAQSELLISAIGQLAGPAIFISNEVGFGIVPDTELGRRFRDIQGRLNQSVAAACEAVVFVAAGLPLVLKPAPQNASPQ
jgi:adenosylcobinamide kinase / adenosylcobinamide-phosphate guanylyltransferase